MIFGDKAVPATIIRDGVIKVTRYSLGRTFKKLIPVASDKCCMNFAGILTKQSWE